MDSILLYCDGACRGNNQKDKSLRIGGYGIILIDQQRKKKKEIKYAVRSTTNNEMELTAVIKGLEELKKCCKVDIITDSKYVVRAINEKWLFGWKNKNWKKSDGKTVANKELWQQLYELLQKHDCKFIWVKGHNDNEWNERCDKLANIAMDELK